MRNAKRIEGWTVIEPGRLEEELYKNYYEILTQGEASGGSYLAAILNSDFKKLKAKETDDALKVITEVGKIAKATSDFYNRKTAADSDYSDYMLQRDLMPWQKSVYSSPDKRIALLAGRRAGKTYELARDMIAHCVKGYDEVNGVRKPRQAIYVGLTFEKAREVIWELIMKALEEAHVAVKRIDKAACSVEFTNGASLRLYGNNSKAEREKLRGLDFSMIVVDECQSQQGLLYLMTSIVGPIIKGRAGKIMMAGTAPLSAGTYWEQCLTNDTYSVFRATMADNTSIPNYQMALQEVLRDNGWTPDNITYRREYLGEITYDTNLLIYPKWYTYSEIPADERIVKCYIGVDYGYVDAFAIAPILITDAGKLYLRHQFKQARMSSTEKIEKLIEVSRFIKERYGVSPYIITDTNEQGINTDISNAGVPNVQLAYKRNQKYQISLVRDALETGTLKIEAGSPFEEECQKLVWKWDSERGVAVYEIDDQTYHGDICDAVQYAVSTHYADTVGAE